MIAPSFCEVHHLTFWDTALPALSTYFTGYSFSVFLVGSPVSTKFVNISLPQGLDFSSHTHSLGDLLKPHGFQQHVSAKSPKCSDLSPELQAHLLGCLTGISHLIKGILPPKSIPHLS